MKKIIVLLLLLTCILGYKVKAQQPIDRAVRIEVSIVDNNTLELSWIENQFANSYDVYRRDAGSGNWGAVVASLPSTATSYKDETVTKGQLYEYRVIRRGSGSFIGYGYAMSGIEVETVEFGKRVLVIVEKELADSINAELDMLQTDLAMSGWNVELLTMEKSKDVGAVKTAIENLHKSKTIDAVYLLGHVAVPYSGKYCADARYSVPPDGHSQGRGNHCGAWPADVYYGINDGFWTDVDSITVGTRSNTANRIGDGKFDQIELPGTVTIAVGRVDFSNMPAFPKTEVALTKQYIQKIHNYKTNQTTYFERGVVDDNFKSFAESFSSTGWRNFSLMFGRKQVNEQDFFTTVKDSTYMFSMLDGAGSFTSCNGIGTTTDYVNNDASAMFNFTFGSFFGDWDVRNNLLRAALATSKGGLTNAWSGRPYWQSHSLAIGFDMATVTMVTQNNRTDYFASFFANNIHIALMGDPTLRLYPFDPASNVIVTPSGDRKSAKISWTASTDNLVSGYDIYVSTSKYGYYEKMNSTLITGTSFDQDKAYNGTNYYMVRAVMTETTKSGSFTNYSHGAIGSADNMVGETRSVDAVDYSSLKIYPNPSSGIVHIENPNFAPIKGRIEILGLTGELVKSMELNKGSGHSIAIDLSMLTKGVYFVRIGNTTKRIILQ